MSQVEKKVKTTPTCKICCACPKQRQARDECVIFKGMDQCTEQFEAFYKCLLEEGFTAEEVQQLQKNGGYKGGSKS